MRCQTYVKVAPISSSICHFIVGSSQFNKEGKIFSSIRRGKKSKKNVYEHGNSRDNRNDYNFKWNSERLVDVKSICRNNLHSYITAISRKLIL